MSDNDLVPSEYDTPEPAIDGEKVPEDSQPRDRNAGLGLDADGVLRIQCVRRRIPVEAVVDEAGTVRKFMFVQMNGAERGDYQAFEANLIDFKKGVPVGMNARKLKVLELELISRCLWTVSDQGTPAAKIGIEWVAKWPSDTVDTLARFCEKLNAVGKDATRKNIAEAEEDAKKS